MNEDTNIALADATGALMMINKKERRLLRELLAMSLKSPSAREWISTRLGREYVDIGDKLLRNMGGE